jgi:hypothetical protein
MMMTTTMMMMMLTRMTMNALWHRAGGTDCPLQTRRPRRPPARLRTPVYKFRAAVVTTPLIFVG